MEMGQEERSHLENKKEAWKRDGELWCQEAAQQQQATPKEMEKEQTWRSHRAWEEVGVSLEPPKLHTGSVRVERQLFLAVLKRP